MNITSQSTENLKSFLGHELLPSISTFHQCVLTGATVDPTNNTYTGAVYRMDGSLVLESLRPSGVGHWRPVDPITIDKRYAHFDHMFIEDAIYGGTFFSMWGHFLLETLSTAYAAQDYAGIPALFTEFAPSSYSASLEHYWDLFLPILKAAGWTQLNLKLVKGPIKFGRLVIPQRLAVHDVPPSHEVLSPIMEATFESIRRTLGSKEKPSLKIFAQRPQDHLRTHPAESELSSLLASQGFVIADVAKMLPSIQVELFSKASVIAGFSGSNLHNSLFADKNARVFEIADSRSYDYWTNRLNTNQVYLCKLLKQQLHLIESYNVQEGELSSPLSAPEILKQIDFALKF